MIDYLHKRAQKKQRYPQWFSACLVSFLFTLLGGMLAFLLFARNAPLAMNDAPALERILAQAAENDSINPAAAYYMRAPAPRAQQWQAIRSALTDPESHVVIPTADINGWLQALVNPPPPPADVPTFGFAIRQIQFTIPSDHLAQWSVSANSFFLGRTHPIILLFDYSLSPDPADNRIQLDRLRINAAPVPPIPGLRQWMARSLAKPLKDTNDFIVVQSAYRQAHSIRVDALANTVTLSFTNELE
jgi:hypothetical protein